MVWEPCCWSWQSIAAEHNLCISSPRMAEACCLSQERMLKDGYGGESFPGITAEGAIIALTFFFLESRLQSTWHPKGNGHFLTTPVEDAFAVHINPLWDNYNKLTLTIKITITQSTDIYQVRSQWGGLLWAPLHPSRQSVQLGLRDKSRQRKLQGQTRANSGQKNQKDLPETASSKGMAELFGLGKCVKKKLSECNPVASHPGRICAGTDCIAVTTKTWKGEPSAQPWHCSRRVRTTCLLTVQGSHSAPLLLTNFLNS